MTKRNLYQVRMWQGSEYSRHVGYKMRLLDRATALRIVKRLKRSGFDAYAAPIKVAA